MSDDEYYEVQQILDIKLKDNDPQVLIRWKGYSEAYNSWEPINQLNQENMREFMFDIWHLAKNNKQKRKLIKVALEIQAQNLKSQKSKNKKIKDQDLLYKKLKFYPGHIKTIDSDMKESDFDIQTISIKHSEIYLEEILKQIIKQNQQIKKLIKQLKRTKVEKLSNLYSDNQILKNLQLINDQRLSNSYKNKMVNKILRIYNFQGKCQQIFVRNTIIKKAFCFLMLKWRQNKNIFKKNRKISNLKASQNFTLINLLSQQQI